MKNNLSAFVLLLRKNRRLQIISAIVVLVLAVFIFNIVSNYVEKSKEVKVPPAHQVGPLSASFSIGGNGEIRVSGIMVTEISGDRIMASSSISNSPVKFVINTNKNTMIRRGNATSSVSKLQTGDVLIVAGTLESFEQPITFLAKDIRTASSYGTPPPIVNRKPLPVKQPAPTTKTTNTTASSTKKAQ
jgi:hypothetical protein